MKFPTRPGPGSSGVATSLPGDLRKMGTRVWGKFIVPKLRNRLVFCLSSLIDGLSCPGLPFLGPFYGFHDATVSQKRSSTNHFFEMFSDLFLSKNEVLGGPSFSMLFTGFSLSFHGLFTLPNFSNCDPILQFCIQILQWASEFPPFWKSTSAQ